ncbi:MAG: hypothetical protein RIQ59_1338, partial [Bacteroidota bacterium]
LNWKKENLLISMKESNLNGDEKRERVLLNVFDALWLLIIKELRGFNVDFPTIRAVKDIMYSNVELDQDKLNSTSIQDLTNAILKHVPDELKEAIKPLLLDGSFLTLFDKIIDQKNHLLFQNIGGIFSDVFLRNNSVSLIIKKNDGFVDVIFLKNENGNLNADVELVNLVSKTLIHDTFINIPIIPLFEKMFENTSFDKYNFQFDLFNENEKKIIDALNDDLCKEIKINKHQSGDITLNLTFEEDLKNNHAKEVRRILGLKQYEKIELVYRNDKHLVINNTRKEILKKV